MVSEAQIRIWEERISQLIGQSVSILNPDPSFARVFIYDEKYHNNLSVEAVRRGHAVTSEQLFSIFTPILPMIARPIINHVIQPALGIKQIIAVPCYLETTTGQWEMMGNLFAATERGAALALKKLNSFRCLADKRPRPLTMPAFTAKLRNNNK